MGELKTRDMGNRIGIKKTIFFSMIFTILLLIVLESCAHLVEFIDPPNSSEPDIPPKQENVYRIFVYGGSTVYGMPLKQFSFVSQLEFWLREIHPEKSLEVYNFGSAGEDSGYVHRKIEKTLFYDPDLLIVLTGHNEFLIRDIETRLDRILDKLKTSFATTRILLRVKGKVQRAFFPLPKQVVMPDNLKACNRDSSFFKKKFQMYFDNLQGIVKLTRKNNTDLILMTVPSNLVDWPPVYKRIVRDGYDEKYESRIAEVNRLLADNFNDNAIARIHELLQTYSNDAMLLYLLAKANTALGNYERARTLFTKARELDPMPWRVLSEFNHAIRDLDGINRVHLVDVEKVFQQQAVHGLVGFSLFADNCHPTPLGNAIISRELLKVMSQERLFLKNIDLPNIDEMLEYFLSRTAASPEKRRSLEVQYFLANAKYSMKMPFYNFKASKMYLDKALALEPSNWKIWINLATLALLDDRIEEGQQYLRKAIHLQDDPIDPNNRKDAPYLKEALEHSGIEIENIR